MRRIFFVCAALVALTCAWLFKPTFTCACSGSGESTSAVANENITFSKDVAPIFFKSCTGCHRPGEIAPMSLLTYKDARPWAKSIRDKVANKEMPPWHADPNHGEWRNDRRITQEAINTIIAWVNGGAPKVIQRLASNSGIHSRVAHW